MTTSNSNLQDLIPLLVNETEAELLVHACKHMIDFYDQDVKRHRSYQAPMRDDNETKAVINRHIESGVHMIGYYQRLKDTIRSNIDTKNAGMDTYTLPE